MGWGKRLAPLAYGLALGLSACAAKTSTTNPPAGQIVPCTKNCEQTQRPGAAHPGFSAHPGSSTGAHPTFARPFPAAVRYVDDGNVGQMSPAYLRPSPATKLYVEIAYVRGKEPLQRALDQLATVLRRETKKEVTAALGAQISQTQDTYTFQEVVALAGRYRTHHSGGATATVFLLSLNGSLKGAEGVLGAAFTASSVVLFPDQMDRAATALVQPAAIQRAVLVHEAGHLLGLVNVGYTSRYDHEDPDHPGHSRFNTSVMYWAIEDISITALLRGGPPDDFDTYDRADLSDIRRT